MNKINQKALDYLDYLLAEADNQGSNWGEIKNNLREAKTKIEKLEKKQQSKRWKPEEGEEYLFIENDNPTVKCDSFYSRDTLADLNHIIGNCFITKEESEANKGKILKKFKKLELISDIEYWKQVNDDVKLDWEDEKQNKYYVYYDYYRNEWMQCRTINDQNLNQHYFSSAEIRDKFLETFKDRLHLLLED